MIKFFGFMGMCFAFGCVLGKAYPNRDIDFWIWFTVFFCSHFFAVDFFKIG